MVIIGRTGLEKLEVMGLTTGARPARGAYSEMASGSVGEDTITVGTGEVGETGEGSAS